MEKSEQRKMEEVGIENYSYMNKYFLQENHNYLFLIRYWLEEKEKLINTEGDKKYYPDEHIKALRELLIFKYTEWRSQVDSKMAKINKQIAGSKK